MKTKIKHNNSVIVAVAGTTLLAFLVIAVYFADAATTVGTNISTDGTLTVSGATTLNGNATLGDNSADTVTINGAATAAAAITFNGSTTHSGTTTIADGKLLDLSAILHDDTAQQGFLLPQRAGGPSANPTTAEGYLAYDSTANSVKLYNGSGWVTVPGTTTRSVELLLGAAQNVSDSEAISWTNGNNNDPEFRLINSHLVIAYDDGSEGADTTKDSDYIGWGGFRVPPDYSSDGSFVICITKDEATATKTERINCTWSINGATESAGMQTDTANQTAYQCLTTTPTSGTPAANDSLAVNCIQSQANPDDITYFHSVQFRYTATQ